MEDGISFLLILIFLGFSAFFSGSETAFFSLTKIQLKKLEKKNSKNSRRIIRLLNKPRQLLILILLGNTIVNVAAASTAALLALKLGKRLAIGNASLFSIFIEIIVMTLFLLIFGEITPKLFAYSSPEHFASFSALFLEILSYILWPIIKILDFIGMLFSNKKSDSLENKNLTSEEFKNLVNSKAADSSLEESEKKIITSIFRFSETTVKEIMVPRVDIIAVDIKEGLSKIKEVIIESGFSRIPIYKKTIDNIIGFIYAKDIILDKKKTTINSLIRKKILNIPENVKIQNLLNTFKKTKVHVAIIVDEYGGTSGLITLEDILEELVGEINDEYDTEKPMLIKINNTEYSLNGMISISELNEEFSLDIDNEEFDNLADFLTDSFNKLPQKNENFVYKDLVKFTITNVKSQRINSVNMQLLSPKDVE
ncbi:MAG: hemolysin family protein [Candidatus Cloacimonetes bacterium]|nr:hemolysin family protein [Candidatus Cloacimonadota bacterium]